ncbi:MAG: hypothetical protein COC19_04505 [SAR86 cluster bacterium]|uniref:HTH araC/xylS-type domain-containing protein n=1 Tax=SAR86 cluster bacterium TaxID=2030880 RepID=A0A2A4MP95_9GAMM|nr:MAG: hypothetical protein COC19_04505 [SAR86 cluster bacterium]
MPKTAPNKLYLWRDSVLYLGVSFEPDLHRHNAVQCCIALDGKLMVRSHNMNNWQSCQAAIIASNVRHSVITTGSTVCLLYLEKTSDNYRSIMDYYNVDPACNSHRPLLIHEPISAKLQSLFDNAIPASLDLSAAEHLKNACLTYFKARLSPAQKLDARISRILVMLHQHPNKIFLIEELCDLVHLSESRLQHLFKAEMGLPIRKYCLWMRLRHVVKIALHGGSLTAAAHGGGFSDAAHFSRTFKSMFGITPSTLFSSENSIESLVFENPIM